MIHLKEGPIVMFHKLTRPQAVDVPSKASHKPVAAGILHGTKPSHRLSTMNVRHRCNALSCQALTGEPQDLFDEPQDLFDEPQDLFDEPAIHPTDD
eukprot:3564412-Amphidinium_carterae.1